MKTNYLFVFITALLTSTLSMIYGQTVSTNAELQNVITNAVPGSTIILANGIWNDTQININVAANIANPVIIKAQTPGQVLFEGKSNVSLGGSFITFEGIVFQNPSGLIVNSGNIEPILELRDTSNSECNNCTITNIKIDSYNGTSTQEEATFKWIIVYGQNNEISYSSFVGKNGVGSIINDNRNDTDPDYTKIHHNYFADRTPVGEINALNDQDAIRIGNSSTSLTDSFTEIYDNLFLNWSGEVEIISNKSGKNKYYNNTFKNYQGALTLRHGDNCEVFNNYFFADNNTFSAGIRVIGEGHKIYNNYIEGVNTIKPDGSNSNATGGINISNGRENSALNGYYQVKNALVVNNTLVNCNYAIRVGTKVKSDLSLAPENTIIANNIMLNSADSALQEVTAPIGTSSYNGNITQNGSWDLTNGSNGNQIVNSGLLTTGNGFYRLVTGSAAIDSGMGTYSFLSKDILGGSRPTAYDAGAEEFGANGSRLPYIATDVGNKVGFGASENPNLMTSTNSLTFNVSNGSKTFDINANIDWSITDDADWLTLTPVNGTNNATITATVTENTSGLPRTAVITISENGGTLVSNINVSQSDGTFDPNDAESITVSTVTGVGTQDPNIPENTIDGITPDNANPSTRWSGNSNDGSSYLTFDLNCPHIITSVHIYFHKGNIRSSSFKISVSNDGNNFTDVTSILESTGTTTGFEEFNLSPYPTAQYVRISGYGNSEGSGWNSYEEVEIHGDINCSSLSVEENSLASKGILIYPVPTTNNIINIKSQNTNIGLVEIFDLRGRSLIKKQIKTTDGKVEIEHLSKGTYITKIQGAYGRFVIQ